MVSVVTRSDLSEKDGREYRSATKSTQTFVVDLADSYSSVLNNAGDANDFLFSSFSLTTPAGFNDGALHTPQRFVFCHGQQQVIAAGVIQFVQGISHQGQRPRIIQFSKFP